MALDTSPSRSAVTRVSRTPTILSGEPTVGGSRTTVAAIVLAAQGGDGVDGIRAGFPHLTPEDVADALAYYLQHRAEIDAILADYESE